MSEEKTKDVKAKEVIAAQQVIFPCGAEVRRIRQVIIDYDRNGRPIYDEMEC
jgi:hypothetical protein